MQMILVNPFYYGAFKFNGELYEGKHAPMVAKKLFDRCAAVMAQKSRPKKRGEKVYPLRGLFLCGECKCAITAEDKTKKSGLHYVYYRCTKKKGPCSQPYIRQELLASQISDYLQKVSLPEDWAVEMLKQLEKDQTQTAQSDALHTQTLKDDISVCEAKLDVLLDAHLEKTITGEEYTAKKNKILARKIDIEQKLKDFERKGNRWLELTRQFVLDAKQAGIVAKQENLSAKKDFLEKVGSNRFLLNREISVTPFSAWGLLAHFHPPIAQSAADSEKHTLLLATSVWNLVFEGIVRDFEGSSQWPPDASRSGSERDK